MSPLIKSLLIFLGAGLGGNARYWIGGWVADRTGPAFPWPTLAVNVSGGFLIGLAATVLLQQQEPLPWRLFLIVGFLGGYTTFSTFSIETMNLLSEKSYAPALANVLSSLLGSLLATWIGLVLGRILTRA
ncbi:MAG TPA: fluoride efflux transporter CrcB [Fimbriimonas sp.]